MPAEPEVSYSRSAAYGEFSGTAGRRTRQSVLPKHADNTDLWKGQDRCAAEVLSTEANGELSILHLRLTMGSRYNEQLKNRTKECGWPILRGSDANYMMERGTR